MSKLAVVVFMLTGYVAQTHAQLNESEIKAAYLLNFLDNLEFEDQSELDSVRVVVVDNAEVLSSFKKISSKKLIQGKPIASSNNKKGNTQLVYIAFLNKNKFKDVALNFQKSAVVGDIDHYMSDIQFLKNPDESIGFVLSANRLASKNIKASTELLVYNKDKSDILSLIDAQQKKLDELISQSELLSVELENKEQEVNSLNNEISLRENRLKELNNANLEKSEQLNEMQSLIKLRESDLSNLNADFNTQSSELNDLKLELSKNYEAIAFIDDSLYQLQQLLTEKKKLVQENESLLASQQEELHNKEDKIEASDRKASRNLLLLIIAGGFTLILIFVLIILGKENKAKKEALKTIALQNESIQEASKQKDEFISNLSHEVRSPLNAIIGYSDLIRNNIKNPETKKNLEYITMSSKNLLGMINDILDYRRIEAGKGKIEHDDFELESLVQVVFNTLRITAENKGLEYSLDYDAELPHFVRSDSKKISQILLNLISNAIKFTSDGKVELSVKKVAFSEDRCQVRFCVSDTGIGIEKENQKLIFEKFTQETDNTAKEFGGSGLGLSISRKLIELLDSEIEVTSEPGQGANFSFDLQLEVGREMSSIDVPSKLDLNLDVCQLAILVVDDLEINRTLLKKQFESQGCDKNIFFAANGLEALDVIGSQTIDLVLTDIRMPLMNGIELARALRKRGYASPIIGISANNLKTEIEQCMNAGMNGFLVKPYSFESLLLEIANHISLSEPNSVEVSRKPGKAYFDFERLKDIAETASEFESMRSELVDEFKKNLEKLASEKDIEIAHSNVNKAIYFGNDNFVDLCKAFENAIRNEDDALIEELQKEITLLFNKHI